MNNSEFVYTIYIRSTAEKVWDALVRGDLTRQYWAHENISDWKKGSGWQHVALDEKRTVRLVGEIVEIQAPRRLVLTWIEPQDAADSSRHTRVTFDIEPVTDMVRLTVTHSDLNADMRRKIANGWPRVLSSMKSFLESGQPLNTWA
jgi:uncharacterized protein YndB with AHSA1/START domain